MFDFLAPLFGRIVVYVEDPAGRVRKLWAKRSPFNDRLITRWDSRTLILEPGGSVKDFKQIRWMRKSDAFKRESAQ